MFNRQTTSAPRLDAMSLGRVARNCKLFSAGPNSLGP
jgi:hypothetical protein